MMMDNIYDDIDDHDDDDDNVDYDDGDDDDDDDDDGRQWKLGVISTDHDESGVTESLTTVEYCVVNW